MKTAVTEVSFVVGKDQTDKPWAATWQIQLGGSSSSLVYRAILLIAILVLPVAGQTPRARRGLGESAACQSPFAVGFRVIKIPNGPKMALWYPTTGLESNFRYSRDTQGTVALNGAPARCARFPLVVFSHGFGGCGIQTVFFTEELARQGYVVAAPDHKDAGCSVDGSGSSRLPKGEAPFLHPERWNETTYVDRRDDLELAINWLLGSSFGSLIDASRIGAAGHSLGGYTVLGLAGGWKSWKDDRIKAVLLFSPYMPFRGHQAFSWIEAPVMYQGAQFDIFVTPSLRGDHGAYAASNPPKYYVELRGGTHFEWTNLLCAGKNTGSCIQSKPNARLIDSYAIAFLDNYLKEQPETLLRLNGAGLAAYQHSTPR